MLWIPLPVVVCRFLLCGLIALGVLDTTSVARAQSLRWYWCENLDNEKIDSLLYELNEPAPPMSFDGESLRTVLGRWPVPIRIDQKALEDSGISIDESIVHVGLPGETWMSRLESVLDPLELEWMPAGDGLEITTEYGDSSNISCLYFLPMSLASYREELSMSIERDVTPNAWESNSGVSSISVIGANADTLGVRASMKTHLMLQRYLTGLERHGVNWSAVRPEDRKAPRAKLGNQSSGRSPSSGPSRIRSSQLKGASH
ncbi:MAG: hypothetical protein MUC83_13045 [Pirellula sp.]|jgi:hypothetical protein|nr:hypothetical protein [Pirellula sp.]